MTDKRENEHHQERDGEYTDVAGEDVDVPEPESGEYTDSEIPGDE